MGIKAVIFDMDGVLIDAKEWHYLALNKALKIFGHEISLYDHLVTYDGLPTKKKLEMLTKERGLPISLHQFINDLKQRYTLEIVNNNCYPLFVHRYALSKLKNEGYLLAVCSNSIRNSINVMLEKADIINYFNLILSNQDVKHPKPNPEIYIKAINSFGLSPKECLIVEDNEHGIKAAIDSGANLLRVNNVNEVNYENIINKIKDINL
jgi:beta-phosphoglucomutase